MSKKARSLKGSLEALLPGKTEDPQGSLLAVARELFVGLDTPLSLGLEICLRYGELEQVVRKRVNPLDYNDSLRFRLDYQAVSFLAKAPLKIKGVDPQAKSVESFLESEEACRQTNMRIRLYRDRPEKLGPQFHSILHGAAGLIAGTLGDLCESELLVSGRFGPGADSSTFGDRTTAYDKMLISPEVTRDAAPWACRLVNSLHGLQCSFGRDPIFGPQQSFAVSDFASKVGNRITFVPKTAVIHRAIAIEPHLNIYLQLGVGAMIRRRLKRRGLDLDSQEGNQYLAKVGSIENSLCTIDLSAASDTLARELVRELIPEPWFTVMDDVRSKVGLLRVGASKEADVIRYEKFSSMGNGFTFELETLIFWALAKATTTYLGLSHYTTDNIPTVRVYGDDIVVPAQCYALLVEVLSWCGFTTNRAKSFSSGYFRESCGKDYYNGTPVRPFFQKEMPNDVQALFRMANGLRRAAFRSCRGNGCDNRYLAAWNCAVRRLPKPFRGFYQPLSKGVNPDEVADYLNASASGGCPGFVSQEANEVGNIWQWRPTADVRGAWETRHRDRRGKETPSSEEIYSVGFSETDDSVALVGNLDEAMGSRFCRLKWENDVSRPIHITWAIRAEPRRFAWDTSNAKVFGVLLYETRNGREMAQGSQSTSRGSGKPHVVILHWEQWRDLGPWC